LKSGLFDVDVFGFQNELCCRYFCLFLTWHLFGLFFKKFGNFFFLSYGQSVHATDLDEDVGAGVSLTIENLERIFQNLEMKGRSQQFPALPPLLVGAQLWTQL